jgi:alpha-D-ribose 1-methylphosphonate 5-triphosphate synthase subunit PhnH
MTVTNVQQQDARAVAIDAAIVAAIRLHAPEFEAAYLGDDIPLWLDCLLDRWTVAAERLAEHTHAPLIETLSALLAQAMVDHHAPGIVPCIGLSSA